MDNEIAKFVQDRNEALLSLDESKIRVFAVAYGIALPIHDQTFWGMVHKARLEIPTLSEEAHKVSREWLHKHGMKTFLGDSPLPPTGASE